MKQGTTELLQQQFDLKEYEASALEHLLGAGRSTAPDVAEATGIPKARVYSVLEALSDRGFVEIIPGRPKEYQSKSPEEILDRAIENHRQEYEDFRTSVEEIREEFLDEFGPLYEQTDEELSPTADLFHVVDVGDPSESETRKLYRDAEEEIHVITNSFAYFDAVEVALDQAVDRGIDVAILFLDPSYLPPEKRQVQAEAVAYLQETYPSVSYRFSEERLPWRGTFVDPSMEYDSGKAIFLVEEKDVPNWKRQAAITENGSFVAGMKRYFDLIWDYESFAADPEELGD